MQCTGTPTSVVLFEDDDGVPSRCQRPRCHQAGRAAADDDDIGQLGTDVAYGAQRCASVLPASGFPCAMHANPK